MNNTKPISSCCQASMKVVGGDEGTNYYKCSSCGKPCDIYTQKPSEEWKKKIREVCTYHSEFNEGTSGYSLSNEQFEKLFNLFSEAIQATREETKQELLNELLPLHNIVWKFVKNSQSFSEELVYFNRTQGIEQDSVTGIRTKALIEDYKQNVDNLCKLENVFFQKQYQVHSLKAQKKGIRK